VSRERKSHAPPAASVGSAAFVRWRGVRGEGRGRARRRGSATVACVCGRGAFAPSVAPTPVARPARREADVSPADKRLVRSCRYSLLPVLATGCEKTLRSVANQLFLSSSSQQQRYSLMAVKNHRATQSTQQQAC
jgi:hypothetical protein